MGGLSCGAREMGGLSCGVTAGGSVAGLSGGVEFPVLTAVSTGRGGGGIGSANARGYRGRISAVKAVSSYGAEIHSLASSSSGRAEIF